MSIQRYTIEVAEVAATARVRGNYAYTTTIDGEWCKAEDVAAAIRDAEAEGIKALRDAAIADWSPGTVYSRETARTWLEGVAARVEGGGKP